MDAVQYIVAFLAGSWMVTAQMAPYLLGGFGIAGILSIIVSAEWVERHLGGRGLGPIAKSVLFGIPLPLCSCGVLPVTASIRRHGASRGATLGFLLATPQTGVDSILATWGMLGPVFGVFRPLAALVTGLVGGAAASVFDPEPQAAGDPDAPSAANCTEECCTSGNTNGKVIRALRYGFVTLPRDIGRPLVVGILIAGAIATFVPRDAMVQQLGGGLLAMLVMMVVGIPLYVCATASIPVAIGFMHLGASPGAALVFLVAGPATNAATITTVWKMLGRRSAFIYLATVAIGALVAGFGLDVVIRFSVETGLASATHVHAPGIGWAGHVSAVVLLGVVGYSLTGQRQKRQPESAAAGAAEEETVTLRITGMTCSHCANTVARALRELPGVRSAEIDLEGGKGTVTGARLDRNGLSRVIDQLGYHAGDFR
jgi:uncharacterized membrane protein YraQ (UPF0718 family)/copper chaperone CopZ